MSRKGIKYLSLLFLLAIGLTGCAAAGNSQSEHAGAEESDVRHVIGVAVFAREDPEMTMFCNYYRNYIAESFPADFLVSEELNSAEDEVEFIRNAKAQGAEGIISFYGLNLELALEACKENEMYYVLGSSSVSDGQYEEVKNNPWFLGVIGPDEQEEFHAGVEMAENFTGQGARTFLIVSGGAADGGNYMHETRTEGMLTALQQSLSLNYNDSIENLARTSEKTEIETGREDVRIVISPGYLQSEEGLENLSQAFAEDDFDALLSAVGLQDATAFLEEEKNNSETGMLVGVVDCFSRENQEIAGISDANGNALINYVKGKYASMVAPAFAAMFNALEGDADVVKPDGTAFRLYQTYWTAEDAGEYEELYTYSQNIYENACSSVDLMNVIRAYNAEADFAGFKELTESLDVESVRAKLD